MIGEKLLEEQGFKETGRNGLWALEKKVKGKKWRIYCDKRYGETSFYAYKGGNMHDMGERIPQKELHRQKEVKTLVSHLNAEGTKRLDQFSQGGQQ